MVAGVRPIFTSLRQKLKDKVKDPRDAKKELAMELVTRYHGPGEAEHALKEYEKLQTKEVPDEIPEKVISVEAGGSGSGGTADITASKKATWLPQIMKETGLAKSTGEAMRLIKQGGVKINDAAVTDPETKLTQGEYIIRVGKRRFYKVVITP